MGYTADQLDQKFPDRMEFSRFQVDRVAQRNYLTQSIMNLIGTDDGGAQRISGEKGGEYILNKTEGGWTLSMNQQAAGGGNRVTDEADEDEDEDEDVEWEDVPLEEHETTSGGVVTEEKILGSDEAFSLEEKREQKFQVEKNAAEEEMVVLPEALNDVDSRIQRERLKEEISEKRKPAIKHNFGESSLLSIPNTTTDGETAVQKDASAHTTSETERGKGASEQRPPPTFVPPWFQTAADEHRGVQNVELRTEEEQGEQVETKMPEEDESATVEKPDEPPKEAETVVIDEARTVSPIKEGEHPDGDEQDMQQMAIDRELAEQEAQYQEEEEEEMLESIARESKENARFTSSLKGQAGVVGGDDIDYEEEIRRLRDQKRKDQRDSDEVSSTMVKECQELLQTFGVPYITAPMEAEAQCATLYELGLVDGIVTDDSDCFLFGGNCIYKNMFNQAKWVECYDTETLQREFSLTREKFIDLAQLLGSDYTEGLLGVGPVTGMEIISEFKDLHDFKQWWEKLQNRQGKQEDLLNNELRLKFKRRFITKLFLRSDFPNEDVRQAYLHPQVDWDETEFEWGTPDVEAIRTFLRQTAGWTPESVDEVVLPVLRNQSKKQTKLNFHPTASSIEKSAEYQLNTSKRMQKAMHNLKRKRDP